MPFKYFRARIRDVSGHTHTIYGTSEPKWGQSVEGQAKHIALVRGMGRSKVLSTKVFPDGESWYKAQYGHGTGVLAAAPQPPVVLGIPAGSKLPRGQRRLRTRRR